MRWLAIPLLLLATNAEAARISDESGGFVFDVPPGYTDSPEHRTGRVAHAFVRGQPGAQGYSEFRIERIGKAIAHGPIRSRMFETAARETAKAKGTEITDFEYRTARWKSFDLELMVAHVVAGDEKRVTLGTPVPVEQGAVFLLFAGAASDESRLESELAATIASFEAESNWHEDDNNDAKKFGEIIGAVIGFLVAGGVIRHRRSSAPKSG